MFYLFLSLFPFLLCFTSDFSFDVAFWGFGYFWFGFAMGYEERKTE